MSATPVRWYEAKTGNHQGLVVNESTGENIAVVYDKANAPLIAEAPVMLQACRQAEEALDVLAEDVADTFPVRSRNAAILAMELRAVIRSATGGAK